MWQSEGVWDPAQDPNRRSVRVLEHEGEHGPVTGHPSGPLFGDDVAAARRAAAAFRDPAPAPRPHHARTLADSLQGFVERYGWRAYALPVLVVVTVLSLFTTAGGGAAEPRNLRPADAGGAPASAAPPAAGDIALKSDQPGADAQDTALPAGALPSGADYTERGTGTFRVLPGTGPVVGRGALKRYSIEVENGITGIDLAQFADLVQTTLADRRSWAGHGDVRLQRVDSGPIDFHVTLTSSLTVRDLCGYEVQIETSCFLSAGSVPGVDVNRVVINNSRWVRGDAAYVGDLTAYRIYLINHEDGHALGHGHSMRCLPDGLAPVMMQQTIGLRARATGQMCQANPWPYPPGVKGAPGVEDAGSANSGES